MKKVIETKKILIIISIIIILAAIILFFNKNYTVGVNCPNNECGLLGASCGTVNPEYRDECCASRNKDTPHIMCVGQWKYVPEKDQCVYYCD